jgi:CRISPR-associated protein Cmr6
MARPLPQDTGRLVTAQQIRDCQNVGLLMDKLGPSPEALWRSGDAKRTWLGELASTEMGAQVLAGCRARWQTNVRHCAGQMRRMRSASPLVVGLGAEHVLETSITLHRTYGFPLIPGSALKGLTRTLALFQVADALGVPVLGLEALEEREGDSPLARLNRLLVADLEGEADALADELTRLQDSDGLEEAPIRDLDVAALAQDTRVQNFRRLFGYQGQAGSVIFFDAIPGQNPQGQSLLTVDIMTPHFPKYYRSLPTNPIHPPSDADDPTPVPFLTVAEGTVFWFGTGARDPSCDQHRADARLALALLRDALRRGGIGSKTAAGYGFFELVRGG